MHEQNGCREFSQIGEDAILLSDYHVHTLYSLDSKMEQEEAICAAIASGVTNGCINPGAFCVTDSFLDCLYFLFKKHLTQSKTIKVLETAIIMCYTTNWIGECIWKMERGIPCDYKYS